jgi:hypothetical protein
MTIGRLMNEYEGALFAAVLVIVKAVPDRSTLAKDLRELAEDSRKNRQESAAAVLDMLVKCAKSDEFYQPGQPPLRLVPKDDDKSQT